MKPVEIVRSWKDEGYRLGLTEEERALLPNNPAGLVELEEEDLSDVEGGTWTLTISVLVSVGSYVSYQYCSWPVCPTDYPVC